MALAIATNNAAIQSAAAASSVNRDMETSMARLSTGKRINSARDDAAGVAIASRLSSEIRGTDQAIRNSVDGQALIDTAEGGHKEIENILQRMREISVQSANDTNNTDDRANLQSEMTALITEIDRIASVTTWAGQSMMDSEGSTFKFQVGTATGDKNQISVSIKAMAAEALGLAHAGSAALSDVSFPVNPASKVTAVAEVLAVSYVAPVTEVAAVSYVAPVTAVTEVAAVSYVAPVTAVTGVAAVSYVAPVTAVTGVTAVTDTPAELLQGKFTAGSTSGKHIISINNQDHFKVDGSAHADRLTTAVLNFPKVSAGTATAVTIDLSTSAKINTAVIAINNAWNASNNLTGAAKQTIATVGAIGGENGDADNGKIVLSNITGLNYSPDTANTSANATIDGSGLGVVTFAGGATNATVTYTLADGTKASYTFSSADPGNVDAIKAVNDDTGATGLTASIVAYGDPAAGKIQILQDVAGKTNVATASTGTFDRTANDLITTVGVTAVTGVTEVAAVSYVAAVTGVTEVAAVSYVAPVTAVTEVAAVSYVAPVTEVAAVSYVAPVTAVAASSDGSMTAVTGSRAATDGIFTATAGRTPVTITLKGTTITVSSLNGDNGSADAAKIANEINTGTATHTYKAKANDDGTVTIIAPPGATSVTTFENSRLAVKAIDGAIKAVNTQRSSLGAISNRLSHTVNNLTNISSNLSAAKGGIEDADFAFETTELAKNQILQQASTAMLAQGNASKQNVLSLLQG